MTATLAQPDRKVGLCDIGRRLDNLPVGRVHRKVVVAIGLGLFFEVYEIFLSSTIATALKTQYGFGGTALQLLMASSFIGMFIGAMEPRFGERRFTWIAVWQLTFQMAAAVFLVLLYRQWKRHGGDAAYVPPGVLLTPATAPEPTPPPPTPLPPPPPPPPAASGTAQ